MIDNRPITPSFFGAVDQIYLAQLFNDIGDVIPWAKASLKFSLQNHFKWIQIVNAIPNPLMPEFFVFRNIFRISQNTLEKNRKSIFFNQKIKKLLKNRFMCMPPLRVQ